MVASLRGKRSIVEGSQELTAVSSSGFTLFEAVLTIVVLGVLVSVALPRTGDAMRHTRVNRATRVIATDLGLAFSLAARQRRPVRIAYDPGVEEYTFTDRVDGTLLHRRMLGNSSAFALTSITFSTLLVDVLPTGIATSTLTITVGSGTYFRQVIMMRAGMVLTP